MSELAYERRPLHRRVTGLGAGDLWLLFLANALVSCALWARGGAFNGLADPGTALTSLGRLTGLLGAYLALVQILLVARLPWLERLVGLDRLSIWHRWNGHATLDLILAHVALIVWGYALLDKLP